MTSRYHIGSYWRLKVLKTFMSFKLRDNVLDAGCSDGFITNEIARAGCNIVAVDISEDVVASNKSRGDKNISYHAMDLQSIDENIGKFTKIICIDVLEHVSNIENVIKALCKVAEKRNCIYLTVPLSSSHGHFNISLAHLTELLTSYNYKIRMEKIKPSFSFHIAKKIHSYTRDMVFRKMKKILITLQKLMHIRQTSIKVYIYCSYIPSIILRIIADFSLMPYVKGEEQLVVIASRE